MTKIMELRKRYGLSIAGLCYETRVHPTTLSMVERRKMVASGRVRESVSSFFEIPENEAFGTDGFAL